MMMQRSLSGVLLGLMVLGGCDRGPATAAGEPATRPAGEHKTISGGPMAKATFAAGCFWGVEETFRQMKGVSDTAVGYIGGNVEKPTYEDVCTDTTGHAEAVEVEYDPDVVSYDRLLEIFWANHDPTTPNRQGPDVGAQYRSAIFYHTPEQKTAAEASRSKLESSGRLRRPIVTQIVPASTFWRAEEYHQKYLAKRGRSSCHL